MTFEKKWILGGKLNCAELVLSLAYWPLKAVGALEAGIFCGGAAAVLIAQGWWLIASAMRMPRDEVKP